MARTPNYSFERQERDRLKASKLAKKVNEKRERDRARSPESLDQPVSAPDET